MAVIADLNGAYGSTSYGPHVHAAMDQIVELRPDLVISTGDMVAGQQKGHDYRAMWRAFHQAVTDRLGAAGIPLAVTPGNHDGSSSEAYAEERAIFVEEWASHRPAVTMVDDADYPVRYAFTIGPALFVSLDASTVGPMDAEQLRWLEERLAAHGRRRTSVVFGHLPLHPVAVGREGEVLGGGALEALLVERGVAAYLSGHHHAFHVRRSGGLRLISVGCLGSGARPLLGQSERAPKSFVVLRIDAEGLRSVEARVGERFDRVVDPATLPPLSP